ncbi:PA14 domain-containing protein [Marinobacter antarcticus]|uniref:PA14 domain-containing protein n=1 Tax=Marinobacter antarcticus TaxID=564117 RepID=A0A1M6VGX6_9GAMM|nr:PA14 domain-containing protein [Marinobacter antarcticus]SHK80604.1 PA14 domain-containing protein [Marinobacter antarcticus]
MSITRSIAVGILVTLSITPGLALSESQPGLVDVLYWDDISGTKVSDLTAHPDYPHNPHEVLEITSLDSPRNRGDNFGALVRGYIEPPLDGDYRFYITGDDETLLFLSSSERSDNGELVASVPGWTKVGEFNKYSSQSSDLRTLESGQRYYFEIRFKEGGGNDHFTVAWEGPGFARSVVPSSALHSWSPAAAEPGMSIQEAYHLGYRAGFLDAGANIGFNSSFPPQDEDGDGVYDNWEVVNGLDPKDPADAQSDPDGDLLTAYDEFFLGTTENNADTDGDGIPDGVEVSGSLDPLDSADDQQDKDGDGYSNLKEYQAGTDLNSASETPVPEDSQQYLAGFVGQYFRGINFNQLVAVRNESKIDFDWGGGSPSDDLPSNEFSARWVGEFTAPHAEGQVVYRFTTRTDDGVRLFLAGQAVIDVWLNQSAASYSHEVALAPGESVPVAMEYYEKGGDAVAQLIVVEASTGALVDYGSVFRVPDPSESNATDTDQDGLPNTWELNYGTNVWVQDGDDILNSGNVTNFEAYQKDLDPRTLETSLADSDPAMLATLTWTAPLMRTDGSSLSLSAIDHYLVNYGQNPSDLTYQVQLDGDATSYEFNELGSGDWNFSIQVVDTNGLVSVPSDQVSKLIL